MTTTQSSKRLVFSLFRSNLEFNLGFQVVWTLLRVMAGLLMIHNGVDKLGDVQGFATNVVAATMGLPFPVFFTYCAAYAEIVGAICLILGFLTRPAAVTLFGTMVMAIYFHLKADGFVISSFEMATLYASCYIFFMINGGGPFSLDASISRKLEQN